MVLCVCAECEGRLSSSFPSGSSGSDTSCSEDDSEGGSESASFPESIDGSESDTNSKSDESDTSDCGRLSSGSEGQDATEVPHHTVLEPLHKCHTCTAISVIESHLIIYQFCLKYGLSTIENQELPQLLELHLPGAKFPMSSLFL